MTNFVNILKTVDDVAFKPLFVEKLTDYLNMLNVKVTMDEDFSLDNLNATNYKTLYNMASYEVSSKDNMLASVKFLIATLPKSNELDPHIGIPDIVNFNEMWNSLMHNLYGVDSVEEMMDRLKEYDYIYSYKVLIDKLEKDTTGLKKEQLRTAIQKHRHSFVNFLLKLGRDGKETVVNEIQIANADVSRASVIKTREWNWLFYGMNVNISKDKATVKQDVVDKIFDDYTTFSDKIEKEYTKHKSFVNREDIIGTFGILIKTYWYG